MTVSDVLAVSGGVLASMTTCVYCGEVLARRLIALSDKPGFGNRLCVASILTLSAISGAYAGVGLYTLGSAAYRSLAA
jgi:hypothetical protein